MLLLAACGKTENRPATALPSSASVEALAVRVPTKPLEPPVYTLPKGPIRLSDDTVVYGPIQVSTLKNTWWQQYNRGANAPR